MVKAFGSGKRALRIREFLYSKFPEIKNNEVEFKYAAKVRADEKSEGTEGQGERVVDKRESRTEQMILSAGSLYLHGRHSRAHHDRRSCEPGSVQANSSSASRRRGDTGKGWEGERALAAARSTQSADEQAGGWLAQGIEEEEGAWKG